MRRFFGKVIHNFSDQPKVFPMAVFTAMFERLGFCLVSFLLVLYVKELRHLSDSVAFALFGVFSGFAFAMPALGGYIADNIYGIRRCAIVGLLIEGIGYFTMALPGKFMLALGLTLIVVGVGFFKTAPTDLLARSYKERDPRIDSGFTLYYMAMNFGGFLSPFFAGYLQRYFGWHVAFFASGLSLMVAVGLYFLLGKSAKKVEVPVGLKSLPAHKWVSLIGGFILFTFIIDYMILNLTIADIFFVVITCVLLLYCFYEMAKSDKIDRLKILACLILILMGFVFSVLYFQCFTSFTLFLKRCVERSIFHWNIPTVAFLSLDPVWILILSPILAVVYEHFGKKKKDFKVPTKFAVGLLLVSLCFLTLGFSVYFPNIHGRVSAWWMFLAMFFFAFGELLVSALGVAMVTHIAPKRMYGVMMGGWYLIAVGLAASISGLVAGLTGVKKSIHSQSAILHIYHHGFWEMGIVTLIISIVAFGLSPALTKMASLHK